MTELWTGSWTHGRTEVFLHVDHDQRGHKGPVTFGLHGVVTRENNPESDTE